MPAPIDLTGHKYGRLTVLNESTPAAYPRKWDCLCECGNNKTILGASLRNGRTQSCGCLNKEQVTSASTIHGGHGTRMYRVWLNMKQRCGNVKHTAYSFYGALGITVCDEWQEFTGFQVWAVASGYLDSASIDRIDGTKGYSPDNCRWTTPTIQARNQKQRSTNTSGFTGVSFIPRLNKYQAYLTVNYKKVNLGYFTSAEEAASVRQNYIDSNSLEGFRN